MLKGFIRAFRTPDLRTKLLFMLAMIATYRLGTFIPAPGISSTNVAYCADLMSQSGGGQVLGMLNLFSGGALLQLSIFALGVMPYITASIIVQLLRVVIPRFEELHKEGQSGQAKLTQYTRYLTVGLGLLQSTTIITLVRSGQFFPGCTAELVPNDTITTIVVMILAMTAGTTMIMWFGELMTEKGVGNGMSLLIFTSIAATFPSAFISIWQQQPWWVMGVVVVTGMIVFVAVVFVEQSQRRIPVQYAKRMIGRRMYGGSTTYIPIKVNQAGVIPIIFASSILAIPQIATSFAEPTAGWVQWVNQNLIMSPPDGSFPWIYGAMYFVFIIFFAFFYVSITFNPDEIADNMKRYGGFIPGIRAGRPTSDYLQYVINRILSFGSLYLGLLSIIPLAAFALVGANQNFPFGGASLLIIVGVGLDTVKQIDAKLQQHHYEGILR